MYAGKALVIILLMKSYLNCKIDLNLNLNWFVVISILTNNELDQDPRW